MVRERINKSGEKTFLARASASNGKFHYKTFRRKRDAKNWIADQKVNRNKLGYLSMENKIIVAKYCKDYIESIRYFREVKSILTYECDIKNHILPLFAEKKLVDITYHDGTVLQRSLKKKGLANVTNNRVIGLFKQILEAATTEKVDRKYIDSNPLKGFVFLPIEKKEMSFWEYEEAIEFLHLAVGDYYYNLYLTVLNTGLRLGEVAALQVKKIDFKKNLMTISHSLKRREDGQGHELGNTKNKTTRYFPMNKTVHKILKDQAKGKSLNEFVFTSKQGGHININHFCEREFKPTQEKLGIRKTLRFHDLRHTYASNFIMNGGDLFTLQKVLGHKDVKSTLVYAHLSNDYLLKAAETVNMGAFYN